MAIYPVLIGVGITLMPKLAQRLDDGISYISFGTPKPMRAISLFWRSTTTKLSLLHEMTKQIRKIMTKQKK
jgi:hypothetical protein